MFLRLLQHWISSLQKHKVKISQPNELHERLFVLGLQIQLSCLCWESGANPLNRAPHRSPHVIETSDREVFDMVTWFRSSVSALGSRSVSLKATKQKKPRKQHFKQGKGKHWPLYITTVSIHYSNMAALPFHLLEFTSSVSQQSVLCRWSCA